MTLPNYEGTERLEGFTPSSLTAYRKALLTKSQPQVDFIRRHVPNRPLSVIEIGCGNGRLLFSLEQNGLLYSGIGIDASSTRIKFAQKWKADIQVVNVAFACADVRTYPGYMGAERADLAVCITGCLNYFPNGDYQKVIQTMREVGRYGLFELYKWKKESYRTWRQLPDSDPFHYYMSDYQYDPAQDATTHTKTFLSRDSKPPDVRIEVVYHWSMDSFLQYLLNFSGFQYIDWAKEDKTKMVILAH